MRALADISLSASIFSLPVVRIGGAMMHNVSAGKMKEGGSTISQQLIVFRLIVFIVGYSIAFKHYAEYYIFSIHAVVVIIDRIIFSRIKAFYANCDYSPRTTRRQPASTIKPLACYLPAIEQGVISHFFYKSRTGI